MSIDIKAYLCSEDSSPVQLDLDKTKDCINDGTFFDHVDKFIREYGNLSGRSRLIDYSFIKEIIDAGNFGLLTLIIAVANYGIKNVPDTWGLDAVSLYKNYKPYRASDEGKKPYDYKKGGLGIAHWDSGNLDDIYTTVGFPVSVDRAHFEGLLCTSGNITSWKQITFEGIKRLSPVFSKSSTMRLFDNGLKQDSQWEDWTHDILYYVDEYGKPIYQHYLFKLWMDKFWFRAVNILKEKESTDAHIICLQDAVRISRAGSSMTSLISKLCGKTVREQYELYKGDTDRYVRQKAFCRRCADIIKWETAKAC